MKAIISSLESGTKYTDGEMRVTLRFADGEGMYSDVRLPVSKLGLNGIGTGPHLDQEVEVTLSVPLKPGTVVHYDSKEGKRK